MPNIKPDTILKLKNFMRNDNCDIGTMASHIKNKNEKPVYELNELNIKTGGKSLGITSFNGGFIYSSPIESDNENTTQYYHLNFIRLI